MKCRGIDLISGEPLALSFSGVIESADVILAPQPEDANAFLAPGFIDLQVNGFGGVDYNRPEISEEEIQRSLEVQFATGVTRLYPTIITGSHERITGALRTLVKARATAPDGLAMEGFHVEGPFISPEDGPRGAHPVRWVRPPDIEEFRRFQDAAEGHVRLMTVSPEWPEAPAFIEAATREGVVISVGHTKASAQQIADAVMPAGCAPGPYELGEVKVELHEDGSVRLAGGTRLAGSALRMDHAVANVIRLAGMSLRDAVTLATRNPGRAGRVSGRQRGLVPGDRADIVRFQFEDGAVRILETWCGGKKVYAAAA